MSALLAAAESVTGLSPVWEQVIGRLHPMLVHLPLGLFVGAGIFAFLGGRTGKLNGTVRACLTLGVLVAFATAASGWFFAFYEEGDAEALDRHRWAGVATVALGLVVLLAGIKASAESGRGRFFRWGSVLLALLTIYTGHEGGELVWGSGFATEPLESSAPSDAHELESASLTTPSEPSNTGAAGGDELVAKGSAAVSAASDDALGDTNELTGEGALSGVVADTPVTAVDFAAQVEPILAASCYECHGPKRAKGRLRLDARGYVFSGDNPVILPGDASGSELFKRVILPAGHDDVMPAKGERLNAEQIDVLRRWIDEGATWPE